MAESNATQGPITRNKAAQAAKLIHASEASPARTEHSLTQDSDSKATDETHEEIQEHNTPTTTMETEEQAELGVDVRHRTTHPGQNFGGITIENTPTVSLNLPDPMSPRDPPPTRRLTKLDHDRYRHRNSSPPKSHIQQELRETAEITVVEQLTAALSKIADRPQTTTTTAKGLNFTAPQFGGTEKEFFTSWRRDYDDFAVCMGWSDDMKLRGLSMVLTGRAKQLFQDIDHSRKTTWQSAIAELEAKHNNASASSMTNFTLLERVQSRHESVSDYTVDMVHRLRVAGVTNESHKLSHYYKGLLPNIKRAVFILQPKTLEECERQAKLVEDNIKMNGEQSLTAVDDEVSMIGNNENKTPERQKKSVTFQAGPNQRTGPQHNTYRGTEHNAYTGSQHNTYTGPRHNTYTRSPRYEQPRGRAVHNDYPRAQRPQSENAERQYRPRSHAPITEPRNNRPYGPPRFNSQRQNNQAPPIYQAEEPHCTQCGIRHAWGQHVNPTCSKCGTPGHVRHECQHF